MKEPLPAVCMPETTAENWPQRREQLIELLEQNVFGRTPRGGFETHAELLERTAATACDAVRERYRVTVRTQRGEASLRLALLLPRTAQPVPAVLMISNHDKAPAPAPKLDTAMLARLLAKAPDAWRVETQRMMAGMHGGAPQLLDIDRDETQEYWPAASIVASGRAAAAFYAGEAQPDCWQSRARRARRTASEHWACGPSPPAAWWTYCAGTSASTQAGSLWRAIRAAAKRRCGARRRIRAFAACSLTIPDAPGRRFPAASAGKTWPPSTRFFRTGSARVTDSTHGGSRKCPLISTCCLPPWRRAFAT